MATRRRVGIIAIHNACEQCGCPCPLGQKYCASCLKRCRPRKPAKKRTDCERVRLLKLAHRRLFAEHRQECKECS